jgi:hypothetical protein
MRAPIAYFAGAGTVIAAIGIGLGGGLTIANVMTPHQEKIEQTKLEQRMAAKPIPPSAQADQPKQQADQPKAPVPYVAATDVAVTANAPAAPAQPQPQTQAAAPAPQASPPPVIEQARAENPPVKPAEPQTAQPQATPREQASVEDANAKARDSDLKRLAAEKRKADRRQQWADRKNARLSRDAELRDVEESVRRASDGPRIVVRRDDDDSDRLRDSDRRGDRVDRPFGLPGFNLFGGDRND